jgi:hypothetical protein
MAKLCFLLGLISIPVSIALWFVHPEITDSGIGLVADPALRAALTSAHAERWGIFVGLWVPSLLILSQILEKKNL